MTGKTLFVYVIECIEEGQSEGSATSNSFLTASSVMNTVISERLEDL